MTAAELIFSDNVTPDQYAALVEAAKFGECPNCTRSFLRSAGCSGPRSPKGNRYCSNRCAEIATRAAAPLRKQQPDGVRVGGFDV